jgi:hypothetical protein
MGISQRTVRRSLYMSVLMALVGGLLTSCGTTAHRASPRPGLTSNYNSGGVWLGEPVAVAGTPRECGYLTDGRYTAWNVQVRNIDCGNAATIIKMFLMSNLRPPQGWRGAFRVQRLPPGGPPGSNYAIGVARLERVTTRMQWFSLAISKGKRSAPPPIVLGGAPYNVHFGCRTRSTICR